MQTVVNTELTHYVHTHKADKIARPELFKLNGISHEEKLENLAILLDDSDTSTSTIANLPTSDDVFAILAPSVTTAAPSSGPKMNGLCVVVWAGVGGNSNYTWYLGYAKNETVSGYEIDHLHRDDANSDRLWKYPVVEDLQVAEKDQVLECDVDGEWDFDARMPKFTLSNASNIINMFNNCIGHL